ncbi:Proteasome subunit beta type-7 [Acipenser ruthenus]|uniref:Proteasome subunit beta type-7 n=1 Tax=Acipenser ruthenus TaxID=7906 RepID=A0A444UHR5_ACIRT|nr:Proteasome subunit beta type-7 [Acipenser ruthenus]
MERALHHNDEQLHVHNVNCLHVRDYIVSQFLKCTIARIYSFVVVHFWTLDSEKKKCSSRSRVYKTRTQSSCCKENRHNYLRSCIQGSGSLAAMAVFEDRYKQDMEEGEAKQLVRDAIAAGIFNDLGSGSNIDLCVITKNNIDYIRPHDEANKKGVRSGSYKYKRGTTGVLTKNIIPLDLELVEEEGEAKQLVRDAIAAGIFNDLGSGSNIDLCVITKNNIDYIRPHDEANKKGVRFSRLDKNSRTSHLKRFNHCLLTTTKPLRWSSDIHKSREMEL